MLINITVSPSKEEELICAVIRVGKSIGRESVGEGSKYAGNS